MVALQRIVKKKNYNKFGSDANATIHFDKNEKLCHDTIKYNVSEINNVCDVNILKIKP